MIYAVDAITGAEMMLFVLLLVLVMLVIAIALVMVVALATSAAVVGWSCSTTAEQSAQQCHGEAARVPTPFLIIDYPY